MTREGVALLLAEAAALEARLTLVRQQLSHLGSCSCEKMDVEPD